MELKAVVSDILDALIKVDSAGAPFKDFHAGVGPYGEPQLLKLIAHHLNEAGKYPSRAVTKRAPDLLIPGLWSIEFNITRPFGDNGKEAENWSVNLLHPYPGNVSSIGDCHKLLSLDGPERRAVVVIGYEHVPPKISLSPLIDAFEAIVSAVARVDLGERIEVRHDGLAHPVHQALRIFAWEVRGTLA